MMRTSYDPETDAFHVRFAPDGIAVEGTDEVAPGVMIDLGTPFGVPARRKNRIAGIGW